MNLEMSKFDRMGIETKYKCKLLERHGSGLGHIQLDVDLVRLLPPFLDELPTEMFTEIKKI